MAARPSILALSALVATRLRDYSNREYHVVHLEQGASPAEVARELGATLEGAVGDIENHYTLSFLRSDGVESPHALPSLPGRTHSNGLSNSFEADGDGRTRTPLGLSVLWSEKQEPQRRLFKRAAIPLSTGNDLFPSRANNNLSDETESLQRTHLKEIAQSLDIQDPIFSEQWHLYNVLQPGHDLNVTGVWLDGITGKGAISVVIDDGVDWHSGDLEPNFYVNGSHDYNAGGNDPSPRFDDDRHGTRCAGEIAAARNNVCGLGVAYSSKVAGIRLLSEPASNEDEALAMTYKFQENQIYSCSWGPPDDGMSMNGPSTLVQNAMITGVQQGRQGHGSVYVFAGGNGGQHGDDCNFDGYANSIYSVTVGGIDRYDNKPYYAETCAAQLVVAYSSGQRDAIHTTDVGAEACYVSHGGTSAAAPLVVGIVALALSIRPDLGWRDIQYLCIETAVVVHADDADWQQTATGRHFSHMFGYGKIDAWRFVEAAKLWQPVKPQTWMDSPRLHVNSEVPAGDRALSVPFEITEERLKQRSLEHVEHATVTVTIEHVRRGDLSVELQSPAGVKSYLASPRPRDDYGGGFAAWTLSSVAHWGESGVGTWTLTVKNSNINGTAARLVDWQITLWGASSDSSFAELRPLVGAKGYGPNNTAAMPTSSASAALASPISTSSCLGPSCVNDEYTSSGSIEAAPLRPSLPQALPGKSKELRSLSILKMIYMSIWIVVLITGTSLALFFRRHSPWRDSSASSVVMEERSAGRRGVIREKDKLLNEEEEV